MVITGLKADTKYEFRLLDANGEQIGVVIQKTTEQATSDTPAAIPMKPKVSVVKKGDTKPTISSVMLTWDALPKKATAESNVVYIIVCTTPNSGITPVAVSGTGKLSHTFTGLNQNTFYKFIITAVNADGVTVNVKGKPVEVKITAKTAKYVAVKAKADTKGTIVTGGDAAGNTKTTIDSVTLTWATASRPMGEKYEKPKVYDTKAYIDVPDKNFVWSTGTDSKGNVLTILTIKGLKATTTYTVEILAFVGQPGELGYQKSVLAKPKITTAKYAAVSKVVPTLNGDGVVLNWQLPSKPANGAEYTKYEIDWVVSRMERKTVVIDSIAEDGKSATVLLDTLTGLGIDLTSARKHNFVIRAVIYAEDGITIINQSLETKFAITPSKFA